MVERALPQVSWREAAGPREPDTKKYKMAGKAPFQYKLSMAYITPIAPCEHPNSFLRGSVQGSEQSLCLETN